MAIDLRVAIIEGKVIAPVACSQPADSNREWAKSSCLQAAILFFNTGSLKVKGRTELCLFVTGGLKRQANASRGRTVGASWKEREGQGRKSKETVLSYGFLP